MQECKHECLFHRSQIIWLNHNATLRLNKKNSASLLIFISQELVPRHALYLPQPSLIPSHDPLEASCHTVCRSALTLFPLRMSLCLKHPHSPQDSPEGSSVLPFLTCFEIPSWDVRCILPSNLYFILTFPAILRLFLIYLSSPTFCHWWLLASCPFIGADRDFSHSDFSHLVSPLQVSPSAPWSNINRYPVSLRLNNGEPVYKEIAPWKKT